MFEAHFRKLITVMVRMFRGPTAAARLQGVAIGEGCRILTDNFGSEPWLISVGNRVTVTSGVRFITHDGSTWLFRDDRGRRYRFSPIEIGDDVFIGGNSIIMPGVRIGSRVVVAAGSVVTKSVPSGMIVAGVPARIIGDYEVYKRRCLDEYYTDRDMKGEGYRERVMSVLTREFKPELIADRKAQ